MIKISFSPDLLATQEFFEDVFSSAGSRYSRTVTARQPAIIAESERPPPVDTNKALAYPIPSPWRSHSRRPGWESGNFSNKVIEIH